MCGIAGIIGNNSKGVSIKVMLERIASRGPDGLFYYSKGNISLAHARLSIIDLSVAANQPMVDPDTGNVIVFNGEIYNYIELRRQLSTEYQFVTQSDTEVLLAAYRTFGLGMFSRLRGMFAFAIYDPFLKKVLLARDRIGVKPLFYRVNEDAVLFASEVKSLLHHDGIPDTLNAFKAYEFLADARLDADHQTFIKEVIHLPAGHFMWVDAEGQAAEPQSYWDFPQLGRRNFDASARKEFIDVMDENIRLHLRSDVPVGAFVSGGLDSSTISCFALRNLNQARLPVFSAVLPYFHPENVLIKDLFKWDARIDPTQYMLTGAGFFKEIKKVIFQNGNPVLDGSMYAHFKLCELAREKGVRVLLSGSGGDELFGGYEGYVHAQHARLLFHLRFLRYAKDILKFRKAREHNTYSHLLLRSLYECVPVSLKRLLKNIQLRSKFDHIEIKPFVPHYYHSGRDPYLSNLLNNYKSWTAPPFLNYEDRNSMTFGVEIRVPFFDHTLIEFICQFNTDDVISGSSKSILRNSLKGIVPEVILRQKGKYGFPSPIDHILINDPEGKALFYDLADKTPLLIPAATKKLGDAFYSGKADLSVFWRTLSYMLWYQLYFQNKNDFNSQS